MDFLNTARDLGRLAAELPRAWQMPPSPLPPLPPDEGMAAYAAQLPGKPDAWDMRSRSPVLAKGVLERSGRSRMYVPTSSVCREGSFGLERIPVLWNDVERLIN